ncbi:MFS transporter [Niabella beijingensis]|uniref:MFS transporter n=1 Tax=Niabella beijingensis TaxID=2872700 RepID=UPI001CBE3995|nr:MFS transporter [Niabella beijingensis]MBZ4191784.1 MFS transporter [Niabella beijingensis]
MKSSIKIQLSLMMFLEFFIWGGWFVTLGTFLGANLKADGLDIAKVFSTQSYGAIIAPFIIGLIADRFFNAERILGFLHIAGAILMYMMFKAEDVTVFYPYALGYMILYMPTLALVNSVSFRQMTNPEKQFSSIRIWGTIGWIIAGIIISLLKWDDVENNAAHDTLRNTFLMASIASGLLGIFSFTLPKTPPKKAEGSASVTQILGLDALKLLADKNFLIFFISSILICIPLAFYYSNANPFLTDIGMKSATAKMTIGQASEVLFLLLIPIFFKRFGFKLTILVGMFAWVLRYLLFAYGNAGEMAFMLILGIALHGICYDFFFVSGQIYTDSKAGEKYKSSAQGLITLATYGIGQLIGFWVAGYVGKHYADLAPAKLENGAVLTDAQNAERITQFGNFWQHVWIVPAIIAAIVAVLFLLFFRNSKKTESVQ